MAGGTAGKAFRNIEQFVTETLPDVVAATTKGAGRSGKGTTRVSRAKDFDLMTAPELREMMLSSSGQRKLTSDTVKESTHAKNAARLGKQNKLWQAQYEQMVFGQVRDKDAAKGFDAKRDALPTKAAEEGVQREGGNALYDRPDRATQAIGKKAEFEGARNESGDIDNTTRAVEQVTRGRRQAEVPLPDSTGRRERRNPGQEEAEAEDIGPVLQRGTYNWKNEPKGSDVIAGGGDGSTALPVSQRAAPEPETKVEFRERDEELDPNGEARSQRKVREVQVPGGTVKPKDVEGRARDTRLTRLGGTTPSPYLNRLQTQVVKQIRDSGFVAPYDFTYTLPKSGEVVSVKKGDTLAAAGIRHLMGEDPKLFKDFTGTGLYKNGKLRKGIEPSASEAKKGPYSDADARREAAIEGAGVNPNAPEVGARLSSDEIAGSEVATANMTRMEGRPTQSPTSRMAGARKSLDKEFGVDGADKILEAISGAADDRAAYSMAFRAAASAMDSGAPGTRVSAVSDLDAKHGFAQALMAAANRRVPERMPPSVAALEAEARASEAARGGLGSRPAATAGSNTRWSETENQWTLDNRPLRQHLADNARARADRRLAIQDSLGTPKAGAPGADDGFASTPEAADVTRAPAREYRGTDGGKSVEELIAAGDTSQSVQEVLEARRAWESFKKSGSGDGGVAVSPVPVERNPTLRRHTDPLEPATTVEKGADFTPEYLTGSADAQPAWVDKRFKGNRPKAQEGVSTPAPTPADGELDEVPSPEEIAARLPGRQRKASGEPAPPRTPSPAQPRPQDGEMGTDAWMFEPDAEGAGAFQQPNALVIDTPRELDADSWNTLRGKPSPDEVAASRRGRKEVAESDTVVNTGGDDTPAPPPSAPPPSDRTAPRPAQPPAQEPDQFAGLPAAAKAARLRAAQAMPKPLPAWQTGGAGAPSPATVSAYDPSTPTNPRANPQHLDAVAAQRREAAARVARESLNSRPLEPWQVQAANSPHAGNVTQTSSYDPTVRVNPPAPSVVDTPGSGLDGVDMVDDVVDTNPGVRPQPSVSTQPPQLTRVQRAMQWPGNNPWKTAAMVGAGALTGGAVMMRPVPVPPVDTPDFGDSAPEAAAEPVMVAPAAAGNDAAEAIRRLRALRAAAMLARQNRIGRPGNPAYE